MKSWKGHVVLWVAAVFALAPGTAAQQPPRIPRIGYVYPAGGQQGTSFEVTVGGQLLAGANSVRITGGGIQVAVTGYDRPLTQRQVLLLRDKLEEARNRLEGENTTGQARPGLRSLRTLAQLAKEAGITDVELRKLMEFQRDRSDPKKQPNPQIEEQVTLQVQIASDTPPGVRELRLLTPAGPTNPLRFEVSQKSECRETEPNDRTRPTDVGGALPVVVNGQILPGDVDRFAFTARKGARIVAAVSARALIPYLADAVPGWFQPVMAIYDAKGRELAYADDFRYHPDPILCFLIPEEGAYVLEIRDSIYRGREDFVYRVTIGETPFVTGIFPLGGREGVPTKVTLKGWNLPQEQVIMQATASAPASICVSKEGQISNRAPFAVDTLPEVLEKEPNDRRGNPQPITLPRIINGCIDRPGDVDIYRIEGRAGSEIVAETQARRLGSPLDSILILTDARGRQIAANDDCEDRGAGLITHHADSRLQVRLPANGTYYLTVRDAQQKGSGDYAYRLRLSPPRPDFELRVTPSSLGARAGASVPVTVYVLRRDGFNGEIALELKQAPPGFVLSGERVPTNQDRVQLTLTVPATGRLEPFPLRIQGRATIQGMEVCHPAVPAEEMMQAFAYKHLVPTEEWLVSVLGRARRR